MTQPLAVIMAGGTGGHIFPALAVAAGLQAEGWRVVWLGTRQGLESRLVPPSGIEIEWLAVRGVRGKGLAGLLTGVARLALAVVQAVRVLRRRKPDLVVGFGGFAALPGGLAAALLRRPLLIHESNAVAGLTNRLLALLANSVLEGFPASFTARGNHPVARYLPLPRATQVTGNPVRSVLTGLPDPALRFAGRTGPLRLLVIGGSQGARALNVTVPAALALLPVAQRPLVRHQAGAKLIAGVRETYAADGVAASVEPFIDDMAAALAEADLVVCRSGALTVAELAAVGVASVLVPFPAAVDDHQTRNAEYLAAAQAAVLVPQHDLTAARLAGLLSGLQRPALLAMAVNARRLGQPQATATVVRCVTDLHANPLRRAA